jgi:hypothetical protein
VKKLRQDVSGEKRWGWYPPSPRNPRVNFLDYYFVINDIIKMYDSSVDYYSIFVIAAML